MPEIGEQWSECRCDCHNPPEGRRIEHGMPCCMQCAHCQGNIRGSLYAHLCEMHPDKVGKETRDDKLASMPHTPWSDFIRSMM